MAYGSGGHPHCKEFRRQGEGHYDESKGRTVRNGATFIQFYGKPHPVMCVSAWIDPLGKFYPVEDCGHSRFADEQFNDFDLERKGWVHLSFGTLIYERIRQAQVDTLQDVLDHYKDGSYSYAPELERALAAALESMEF